MLKPNPLYTPWTIEVQRRFVLEANIFYVKQHGNPSYTFNPQTTVNWRTKELEPLCSISSRHQKRLDTLTWLYRLGQEGGYLCLSYYEFEQAILFGGKWPIEDNRKWEKWYYRNRKDAWYQYHGVKFREKQAGQKNSVPVKELTDKEQSKLAWKAKKGFYRSRSKKRQYTVGTKRRVESVKESSRAFRRMEKGKIKQGKWNELADSNAVRKLYADDWDWN